MSLRIRILDELGLDDEVRQHMLAARPAVTPMPRSTAETILARALTESAQPQRQRKPWLRTVVCAPIAASIVVAIVIALRLPTRTPRTGMPPNLVHVAPLVVPDRAKPHQPAVVHVEPQPALMPRHSVRRYGGFRLARTHDPHCGDATHRRLDVPVEFVMVDGASGPEFAADVDSGIEQPVEITVSYNGGAVGSAETVALVPDSSGALVENRCAVAGTDSRFRVMSTTAASDDTGSLFVSIEWDGPKATVHMEEDQ